MTALQGCRDAFGVVEGADADRDFRSYPTGVLPNHLSDGEWRWGQVGQLDATAALQAVHRPIGFRKYERPGCSKGILHGHLAGRSSCSPRLGSPGSMLPRRKR